MSSIDTIRVPSGNYYDLDAKYLNGIDSSGYLSSASGQLVVTADNDNVVSLYSTLKPSDITEDYAQLGQQDYPFLYSYVVRTYTNVLLPSTTYPYLAGAYPQCIGTPSYQWTGVYSKYFYEDGKLLSNKYAEKSHTHDLNELCLNKNFPIDEDATSQYVSSITISWTCLHKFSTKAFHVVGSCYVDYCDSNLQEDTLSLSMQQFLEKLCDERLSSPTWYSGTLRQIYTTENSSTAYIVIFGSSAMFTDTPGATQPYIEVNGTTSMARCRKYSSQTSTSRTLTSFSSPIGLTAVTGTQGLEAAFFFDLVIGK